MQIIWCNWIALVSKLKLPKIWKWRMPAMRARMLEILTKLLHTWKGARTGSKKIWLGLVGGSCYRCLRQIRHWKLEWIFRCGPGIASCALVIAMSKCPKICVQPTFLPTRALLPKPNTSSPFRVMSLKTTSCSERPSMCLKILRRKRIQIALKWFGSPIHLIKASLITLFGHLLWICLQHRIGQPCDPGLFDINLTQFKWELWHVWRWMSPCCFVHLHQLVKRRWRPMPWRWPCTGTKERSTPPPSKRYQTKSSWKLGNLLVDNLLA